MLFVYPIMYISIASDCILSRFMALYRPYIYLFLYSITIIIANQSIIVLYVISYLSIECVYAYVIYEGPLEIGFTEWAYII